jgi:hypothetical protein
MRIVPRRRKKDPRKLAIILVALFLVSCSHVPPMTKDSTADSQKETVTAQKARNAEPQAQSQLLPKVSSSSDNSGRKWTSYARDDGTEYFYDKDAIAQPSKGLLHIWRKREFPSRAAQKEIVTLDEIDCAKAEYRTLQLRVTYWDGRTQVSDKATRWAKIFENSAEEYLLDEHCPPNPKP